MQWSEMLQTLLDTAGDILPIIVMIAAFQFVVIRRPMPNLRRVVIGFLYVLIGLSLFLLGLEQALFPLGRLMATQLTDPAFIYSGIERVAGGIHWTDYYWVYIFAFAIGFSTTIAEPSLMAVAMKANQVSGGAIHAWGLRIAVALGVAIGIALGSYRIVTGLPIHYFIIIGYVVAKLVSGLVANLLHGIDFLTATNQTYNGGPILMSIKYTYQEFWFRHIKTLNSLFLGHK